MIDIDFETRVNFIRSYLPNIDIATIAMTSWALCQGLIKIEYDLVMVEVRNPQIFFTTTTEPRHLYKEPASQSYVSDRCWLVQDGQLHTEEDNDGKSKQKIDAGQQ